MNVTSVDITAGNRVFASFSFRDPGATQPYVIRNIGGLDVDNIVPTFYTYNADGIPYYRMAVHNREVVIFCALNPDYDKGLGPANLRQDLQRAISYTRNGEVKVCLNEHDSCVAVFDGHITKFESALFTEEPGVQMTLKCRDGDILSPEYTHLDTVDLGEDFTINDMYSTKPHGVVMTIKPDATADQLVIVCDEGQFEILTNATDFAANDNVVIGSERNLLAYIDRAGTIHQLAAEIVSGSVWPTIFPTANNFSVKLYNNGSPVTYEWVECKYKHSYWGL